MVLGVIKQETSCLFRDFATPSLFSEQGARFPRSGFKSEWLTSHLSHLIDRVRLLRLLRSHHNRANSIKWGCKPTIRALPLAGPPLGKGILQLCQNTSSIRMQQLSIRRYSQCLKLRKAKWKKGQNKGGPHLQLVARPFIFLNFEYRALRDAGFETQIMSCHLAPTWRRRLSQCFWNYFEMNQQDAGSNAQIIINCWREKVARTDND